MVARRRGSDAQPRQNPFANPGVAFEPVHVPAEVEPAGDAVARVSHHDDDGPAGGGGNPLKTEPGVDGFCHDGAEDGLWTGHRCASQGHLCDSCGPSGGPGQNVAGYFR